MGVKAYLGLGSNLGKRRENLEVALIHIKELPSTCLTRVSPLYETSALLPPQSEHTWNLAFLNIVVEISTELDPRSLLMAIKDIERKLGRKNGLHWAPREIDIDILFYGDLKVNFPDLVIPHPLIEEREFVLDPLKDLNLSFMGQARSHPLHSPIWMGILNLTPDSFSDGGRFCRERELENEVRLFDELNIGIIDIGGESTRPDGFEVPCEEEWERIVMPIEFIQSYFKGRTIRPIISVDTRHFEVAKKALELGVGMINDVSGLKDERFVDLIKQYDQCFYVLTHSSSIPVDPRKTLDSSTDVVEELRNWFSKKIEFLLSKGIRKNQIIIDPGIGFGKNSLQSLTLLRSIPDFFPLGCRILVGHSRKSFMQSFTLSHPEERDWESAGVSLSLVESGVDILRVHNMEAHIRAWRGWIHARPRGRRRLEK